MEVRLDGRITISGKLTGEITGAGSLSGLYRKL